MKKFLLFLLCSSLVYASQYRDGLYRGVFVSKQETQVEVSFNLKNDIIKSIKYKTLYFNGKDYLKEQSLENFRKQYEGLLTYLVGKNVNEGMEALYYPEKIELAGATIRSSKVRSAIKNGLNNDVYNPDEKRPKR